MHATLVDSALVAYQRFVAPLTGAERARYYRESKITARLFGIPDESIPRRWVDFEAYMRDMIDGPILAVGPSSRDIARALLSPPLPPILRQAVGTVGSLTAGLLPEPLRRRYGLAWGPARRLGLGAVELSTRALLPFLPAPLRTMPHARRARA